MKLRRNEYCPIHRSLFCCGREQARKERRFQLGVQRIEDPHHPRGYRELRSPAEMRKLLNRKVVEQAGKCAICQEEFTDYNEIVPYADFGIRHRMPTLRICRPDRFSAEDANASWFRRRHNPSERVKSKRLDELFAVDAEARRKTLTIALGRTDWLHIGSPQAGPKVAAILSIVESCQAAASPGARLLFQDSPRAR